MKALKNPCWLVKFRYTDAKANPAAIPRESAIVLFQALRSELSPVLAYFARYGHSADYEVRVSVQLKQPHARRELVAAARRAMRRCHLKAGWSSPVAEPRGNLSPLHSLIMDVALHPDATDTQTLVDAFHWCCNASGLNYGDEIMLASGMAYSAAANIHPDRAHAPRPWCFGGKSELNAP